MLIESNTVAPHGGSLVDRRAPGEGRQDLVREALGLPRVHLAVCSLLRHLRGVGPPTGSYATRAPGRRTSRAPPCPEATLIRQT